jgi:glycosyltransferase 2 family protein
MAVTETAPARRATWTLWLRLGVSAALLAFLVSRIHLGNLLPEHPRASTLFFFAAGIAMAGLGIVLSAWRWQRALAAFDTDVPLRTLVSHYFAGQFVGNVLPSTIGGDVLRVRWGTKTTGSSAISFASVVLERLTGFVALPLLALLGFVLRPSLLDVDHAWIALAISGVALFALLVILVLAAHPRLAGRFRDHENWMRFIGAVHIGVDRLRRQPRLAAGVLGAALVYQASTVAVVYCAVRTLGVSIPSAAVLAFAPAVAMAQVLPLSLSGLGVREGMLVILLQPLGVSSGRAVAVGLLWYAMMLIVSLLGAPVFAVGHRHPRSDRGDTHPPSRSNLGT